MLNGIDPLLIIVIKVKPPKDIFVPQLAFLNKAIDKVADAVGLPIPFYLSERGINRQVAGAVGLGALATSEQTGIILDSESFSVDVNTRVDGTTAIDEDDPTNKDTIVSQNPIDAQLTLSLVASRDSIMVGALTAMMQMIMKRLVSEEYEIHYLNGSTCIFGARLHRFSAYTGRGTDLLNMELSLSTASERTNPVTKAAAGETKEPIRAFEGATPIDAGATA